MSAQGGAKECEADAAAIAFLEGLNVLSVEPSSDAVLDGAV